MEYDCATRTVAGATLVTVRVRNEAAVPRRVRVRNDLPGPVLPPRREGVPERGWDDDGYTGVVAADDERAVGYACPVDCDAETPASVEFLGRADDDGDGDEVSETEREAAAIRSLGRARPPADAVPTPDAGGDSGATTRADDPAALTDASADSSDEPAALVDASDAPADGRAMPPESPSNRDAGFGPGSDESDAPRPVESWLSAVETRVERAEALTDATAAEAASVLEAAGSVTDLPAAVAADEAALRAVAARATALADRAADADAEPVVDAVGER